MEKSKALELLGMKQMPNQEIWYSWLINEWIPQKGEKHMNKFVEFKFNDTKYIIWCLLQKGHFKKELRKALLKEFKM